MSAEVWCQVVHTSKHGEYSRIKLILDGDRQLITKNVFCAKNIVFDLKMVAVTDEEYLHFIGYVDFFLNFINYKHQIDPKHRTHKTTSVKNI